MEEWQQATLTIVVTFIASSGFWTFMNSLTMKKWDAKKCQETDNYNITEMLIGLGHDRIMYLGVTYIDRGWITRDEYENLHDYLYVPYKNLGGNGSADKIMKEVNDLPTRKDGTRYETK